MMNMLTDLTDRCFNDCVIDFTSSALGPKEDKCVSRCFEKFCNLDSVDL